MVAPESDGLGAKKKGPLENYKKKNVHNASVLRNILFIVLYLEIFWIN